MASRTLFSSTAAARQALLLRTSPSLTSTAAAAAAAAAARSFHATARAMADAPLPARKPVGAFRGGLFGFLLGSTLTGAGVYGYVLREYKASNELLTEDIYALQAACQRLNTYVQTLEEKFDAAERRRK